MKSDYDVIVVGGGPGGIASAIGAARAGASVLLVEKYGFLGGGATAMMVNPFMNFSAGDRQLVHGVLQEMIDKMAEIGAPCNQRAFDAEACKIAAEQLCLDAGVNLLFHSYLADVHVAYDVIEAVSFATKDGLKKFYAKQFVDSTGDGDLAYFAGAPTEKGRSQDGLSQPMTLNFRMADVDMERLPSRDEITIEYKKAKESGEIQCPRENILYFLATQPGVVHFNQTRVIHHDAVDPMSLTAAEIESRRQAWQISRWLIKNIRGFENSYLQQTAPQIGVRESRRVIGDYVLTAEELLSACRFEDVITCGRYPVDIHNPDGEGTVIQHLEPGKWYDIPYRILVPNKIKNLVIGGRSVSANHEAHSAIRVMPTVFGIGHAAGIASALCVQTNILPKHIEYLDIQRELLNQGASLGDHRIE